ncbi:FAD/NAD(P)-binding domain-containing protein [Xylariaceae sp. FL1272]|nr:FAD/NAD(P)-binding domain-containing protein [Xylariaceae sp. FL1272]
MFSKTILIFKILGSAGSFLGRLLARSARLRLKRILYTVSFPSHTIIEPEKFKNIVIIGASNAGYMAVKSITESLLPNTPYRVIVIEPHDRFHFTWVLPRLCVVSGHEHKAFIPYGSQLRNVRSDLLRWIRGRAVQLTKDTVRVSNGEEIPYAFLIVATGAGATDTLPSRVDADNRVEGMALLRDMQTKIREATNLVVVGGGATGVELATDAKGQYPEKHVVMVHSRSAVLHRFGPRLQKAALEGLSELEVEVILGDRVIDGWNGDARVVKLESGRVIKCDYLVNCGGQRPNSDLLAQLSPASISSSGSVRVKSTMQIQDDSLSNVYVCGDLAETRLTNQNSRTAASQALVVADNVILGTEGKEPGYHHEPQWLEESIKLTLGLEKSVVHIAQGGTELLLRVKEKDRALMSTEAWEHMGAKPFEDDDGAGLKRFVLNVSRDLEE